MILNAKGNDFIFRFPKNFFPTHIVDKFNIILKNLPTSYKDINEYINSTIQSVTFPDLEASTKEQRGSFKTTRIYRGGFDIAKSLNKTITIDFKLTEHFLNLFFLQECFIYYYSYERDIINNRDTDSYPEFLPDIVFKVTSVDGFVTIRLRYQNLVYKKITNPLKFSYNDVKNTFKTFTIEFMYNDIYLDYEFKDTEEIDILANKL